MFVTLKRVTSHFGILDILLNSPQFLTPKCSNLKFLIDVRLLIPRKKRTISFTRTVWPEDQLAPWFRGNTNIQIQKNFQQLNNLAKTLHTHFIKEDKAQRSLKKSFTSICKRGDAKRIIPNFLRAVTPVGVLPLKIIRKRN